MKSLLTILLLLPLIVTSQTLHNNSSIFISTSVTVYVNEVNNSGFIMNNGSLIVKGDWTNTDVYQGSGSIILAGTDQQVSNNDQSIQDLTIGGGGKKTILSGIVIKNSIDFNNGIVHFDPNGSLLVDRDATIEGGSSVSFVNGPLSYAGTGYRFFPVGVANKYYPVWLTDVRGLSPVVEVEAHNDMTTLNTIEPVEFANTVYWTQKEAAGQYEGSKVTASIQSVPSDQSRVVFVQGASADAEFSVINNEGVFSSGGVDVASSEQEINQTVFALGTRPEEPVRPSYLSTTLSPNASNIVNQTIRMQHIDLVDDKFQFEVYNRWGNRLFESTSLEYMTGTGWDGKQNGQLLPSGAYPYRVFYRDRTGKETQQTGFITIVY